MNKNTFSHYLVSTLYIDRIRFFYYFCSRQSETQKTFFIGNKKTTAFVQVG